MNIFNKIIRLFLHLYNTRAFPTYIFTTLKSLQNTLVLAQFLTLGQLSNGAGGFLHNSGDEEVCPVSNLGSRALPFLYNKCYLKLKNKPLFYY